MTIGSKKFVLFLMGPTASGKTELAIEISKTIDSKLISVDSALIYKGMDIGTAKPDKKTLKEFPHELIDICEPEDSFSVNDFIDLATTQIELAFKEGKLPILVGGTSFYFNALKHGISKSLAKAGAIVLSPACASFDMFDDFNDRGGQFKHHVIEGS